jgi:hypothetical protein
MQNAPLHHSNGAAGHSPVGLATSDEWGCFTLFYSLRKPHLLPFPTRGIMRNWQLPTHTTKVNPEPGEPVSLQGLLT